MESLRTRSLTCVRARGLQSGVLESGLLPVLGFLLSLATRVGWPVLYGSLSDAASSSHNCVTPPSVRLWLSASICVDGALRRHARAGRGGLQDHAAARQVARARTWSHVSAQQCSPA